MKTKREGDAGGPLLHREKATVNPTAFSHTWAVSLKAKGGTDVTAGLI